jgi:CRP-like cAMP-binding protein
MIVSAPSRAAPLQLPPYPTRNADFGRGHPGRSNRILAALPADTLQSWSPYIQELSLPRGKVLHEAGVRLTHVYFPSTCTVSLVSTSENGDTTEVADIGREGIAGVEVFLGGERSSTQAVVQSGGWGFRVPAHWVLQEFSRGGAVMHLFLLSTQVLVSQIAQTAVCNRHHSVEQRLCRWLLRRLVRSDCDDMAVTQEAIAKLLGVRREGVTEAALALRTAGVIDYHRGHIQVLDRTGLAMRACECHEVVRREYQRLMPYRSSS